MGVVATRTSQDRAKREKVHPNTMEARVTQLQKKRCTKQSQRKGIKKKKTAKEERGEIKDEGRKEQQQESIFDLRLHESSGARH